MTRNGVNGRKTHHANAPIGKGVSGGNLTAAVTLPVGDRRLLVLARRPVDTTDASSNDILRSTSDVSTASS